MGAPTKKQGAAAAAKASAATATYDYSGLANGMTVQAESDGVYYAAEVAAVATGKKRASAPVKVHYLGYSADWDEWLGGDRIRSKAVTKSGGDAAKAPAAAAYDYSGLAKGMRVQAEAEGTYYAAEVVAVATGKSRAKAPVKVHYVGYTEASDEWLGGDRIQSKALRKSGSSRPAAAADAGRSTRKAAMWAEQKATLVRTHLKPKWKPSFPPKEVIASGDNAKVAAWLAAHVPEMKKPDPSLTSREKELARMSCVEYMAARKEGTVTCSEYVAALVKRMKYYGYLNAFMYMDNMPHQTEQILGQAKALDLKAEKEGVAAIAPLYGLPVPAKGTMATTDFPSSAGCGLLHDYYAKRDADFVALLKEKHAVIMGKTNVPEFAASGVTANYANGCTQNPYDHRLISGGSSGGAGCCVAAYLAPIALSEDTGGSTRIPAFMNQNFGYDPSRNHYPNAGNPGMTYTNDQIGLNARSLEDVLALDAAALGLEAEHAARAAAPPAAGSLRVGLPQWPFVEFSVPEGCADSFGEAHMRVSEALEAKYCAAERVLQAAGVTMVRAEWADVHSERLGRELNSLCEIMLGREVNGEPLDIGLMNAVHSFSGQISEWVSSYLGAPVALADIIADAHPLGGGHTPGKFMERSRKTDESQFRYISGLQEECVRVYNSYFDAQGVSVIMMPGIFGDAPSYEDVAGSTCPLKVCRGGKWEVTEAALPLYVCASTFALKNIPIPKLMVPTGLDAAGRPTGVQLWGRAMPASKIYDDAFARTFDLDFLYTAKVLVDLIQADPDLRRTDAPLVADLFAK